MWTPEAAARVAPGLDFRSVGVLTWRGRSAKGRMFDFKDIRTLRALLADARLAPSDAISYDGRTWQRLDHVPNLDLYFVDTWDRLNRARGGQPLLPPSPVAEAPEPAQVPPPIAPPVPPPAVSAPQVPLSRAAGPSVAAQPAAGSPAWGGAAPMVAAIVVAAFLAGGVTAWLFVAGSRADAPAPDGRHIEGSAAEEQVGEVRGDVSSRLAPGARVQRNAGTGGEEPRPWVTPQTGASNGVGAATRTYEPATTTSVPGDETTEKIRASVRNLKAGEQDALLEAMKLEPTQVPGEGQIGDEPPSSASDIVYMEEIPADKVEEVLRREGLLPSQKK